MRDPRGCVAEQPYKLYIDGGFVQSASGETFDIVDPADNTVLARAYKGNGADARRAVAAARRAFDTGPWRTMGSRERSKLLLRVARVLESRLEELACLETLDCGKLHSSVLHFEAPSAVDAFEFAAGSTRLQEGKVVPIAEYSSQLNYVLWQPVGVVAEILPWNGPLMMGCQKLASILAAGNTVVVKPSSWASLSVLALAEVFHEAGLPPGVVNVITGPGTEVGDALALDPAVDMISLTGGTETGKHVMRAAASSMKKLALELGGKSANIVFDDADPQTAARWAVHAFTLNAGQVCVAGTRLLVQQGIYEEVLGRVEARCSELVLGSGFDPRVGLQPLISREHCRSVWGRIDEGKSEGARLVAGGVPCADPTLAAGNFVPPTVFADVDPRMKVFQEEIFGPVLCVTRFRTEEEALGLANSVRYGLAAGIFTADVGRAHRVAARLDAGQVYVNSYFSNGIMEAPATGWKQSGIGDAGIRKYMHPKVVFVNLRRAEGR